MTKYGIRVTAILLVLAGLLQVSIIPLQTANAATKKETLKIVELDRNWKAIGQYSEGLCAVQDKTSGMWGYVDKTGKFIIKPEYYDAMPFSEGLAAVKLSSGFYNFINKAGKVIVSGQFTNVKSRFRNEFTGFKDGLAVVSFGNINKRSNYKLIDKEGNVVKELDENTTYVIDMHRFENKGDIVTNSDRKNFIYDNQYNKLAEFEGSDSKRILFNISSKYIVTDDCNYLDEGKGLCIGAKNGSKIFEQSKIIGMDNTSAYKMGVTDDYIVINRTVNQIQTAAVYDFNGKIIFDYKYKEVFPVAKDMFIVRNNADIMGIVDNKNKELVPFSMGISSFSKTYSLDSVYQSAKKSGVVYFTVKDKQGKDKAKYFDLKTKKILDYIMINNGYELTNGFGLRYNTDAGLIHLSEVNYLATIYDSAGLKIGSFSYFFSPGNFGKTITKKELFISAGVIPVLRKDKLGYTFAVIKK